MRLKRVVPLFFILFIGIVVTAHAFVPIEQAKLTASDGQVNDRFGSAATVTGDLIFIGARAGDFGDAEPGTVYVFKRNGSNWSEVAQVASNDGEPGDLFGGWSLAASGDTLVVGAVGDDDFGSRSGAVYVFKRVGNMWREQAKLTASDGSSNAFFGSSVDIYGDTVVVGTLLAESFYIFERKGATWQEVAKLTSSDGENGDRFGASVAISGGLIVASATRDDDLGRTSGAAYIFRRIGTSWIEQAKLTASDGTVGENFGSAVDISGNVVVIGANGVDFFEENPGFGAAYIYERSGSNWHEQAKLIAVDGEMFDYFGGSVSLDRNMVIIGAAGANDSGDDSGAAYVFERSGSSWSETAKLTDSNGEADDLFGLPVVLDRRTLVIGALRDDDVADDAGAAFVYQLP
ncbi:MAG: hypothetical protein GY943_09595 [Chloroflexi bacterium]|nr:hypothetical protein [Chloroflexota bacterium]